MRTVKQPESTAVAPLQKTKGFGEKGVQSLVLQNEERHEARTCADGRVRVVTTPEKSFMLGQEPKTKNDSEHHYENEDRTHSLCTLSIKTYRYPFKVDQ